MKYTLKKIAAMLLSLVMLTGTLFSGALAGTMVSGWVDPVSGAELEEAETTHSEDNRNTVILYIGETATVADAHPNYTLTVENDAQGAAEARLSGGTIGITALAAGFSTVKLTWKNGNGDQKETGFITVRVIDPGVSLSASSVTADPGTQYKLEAAVSAKPGEGTLAWSSDNESVVTVEDGTMTMAATGTAVVTCTMTYTQGGETKHKTAAVNVTVKESLKTITLKASSPELYLDELGTVTIESCEPESYNSRIGEMTARSTNESVLTVSKDGAELTLTPHAKGTAMVVVSLEGVDAFTVVKVLDEGLEVSPSALELPAGSSATAVAEVHPARKAGQVTAVSSDPEIAEAVWIPGDQSALIRALAEGVTEITFTVGSLTRTVTVSVTEEADTEDLYTVSFVDYDGTVLCSKETADGGTVTVPEVSTVRTGYTFDHFEKENDASRYEPGDTLTVTGNLTLTAYYTPGTSTVTFADSADGISAALGQTLPEAQSVQYGDSAEQPAEYGTEEVEVQGENGPRYWRFIGWKSGSGAMYTFTEAVTEPVVLTPVWEIVMCNITRRTFVGVYGEIEQVEKGSSGFTVGGLDAFGEDSDYYTYTYTNANGVGKVVYFQFWQYGNTQIPTDTDHYDVTEPVLDDMTFTAVYEPGNPRSVGGPAVNDSTNSYYHSTNVFVPVNWVREDNGRIVKDEMVQTNVYPLYGVRTSPVFGLTYPTEEERQANNPWGQNSDDQLPESGSFEHDGVTYTRTAKYGRVNLESMVGQVITGNDGKVYIVTGIDQSRVETVWLCTCSGHTFNGYCLGGTWNALGQVTLFVQEKTASAPKIKVNYYLLPEGWQSADDAVYMTGIAENLETDQVLTHADYIGGFNASYSFVDFDWEKGADGILTKEGEEYVLNIYVANITYKLTVTYWYRTPSGNTQIPADALGGVNPYVQPGMRTNDRYNVSSPAVDGWTPDRTKVTGTIVNHDVYEDVYYEQKLTLNYVALRGGSVTVRSETFPECSGAPKGSTAVADPDYVVVGWYYDEDCAQPAKTAGEGDTTLKFLPPEPEGGYVDGTTYYAKFSGRIVITSPDGEWTYDGDPHHTETVTVTYGGTQVSMTRDPQTGVFTGTLPTGDRITVTPTAESYVTHVSETEGKTDNNTFTWTVENADDYPSVTAVYGDLTVKPAPLTVVTPDAEKVYDGTPLTKEGTVTGFMDGDTATFETTGSRTEVGSSDNTYKLTFDGTADPKDYYIAGEDIGTLTVKPIPVVITSPDGVWTYDGDPHHTETITVVYGDQEIPVSMTWDGKTGAYTGTLPAGDKLTVKPTDASYVTHVSDTDGKTDNNTFTWTVDNANRYTVTPAYGDLTVRPAPLIITTESNEKYYDGDPLTAPGKIEGFAGDDGDAYTFTVTGTQTEVGSSQNGYTLTCDPSFTHQDDYYIDKEDLGTLTVEPIPIVITSPDAEWTYDGDPHRTETITVVYGDQEIPVSMTRDPDTGTFSGKLPSGDRLFVIPDPKVDVTHVGDTEGKTDNNRFSWAVEHEERYSVTPAYGDLTVRPAPLKVVTPDAEKVYDGTPLTKEGTVSGFMDGDTATFETTGSRTEVGSSDNTYKLTFDGTADPKDYYIAEESIGTLTVTPEDDPHRVTVHYWLEHIGGKVMAPDATGVYDEGDFFNIPSPRIPGYTVDIVAVRGTMGDEDLVYNVIYTPGEVELTIRYVDEEGEELADPYEDTLHTGDPYDVESPDIEGYTPDTPVVRGEMPGHDVVITVIYFPPTRRLVTLNDYDTPLAVAGLNVNAGDCFE